MGLQADTIIPEPGNPQALNRYSYVLNNPLKYTDPTGHMKKCTGECDEANWKLPQKKVHPLTLHPRYQEALISLATMIYNEEGVGSTLDIRAIVGYIAWNAAGNNLDTLLDHELNRDGTPNKDRYNAFTGAFKPAGVDEKTWNSAYTIAEKVLTGQRADYSDGGYFFANVASDGEAPGQGIIAYEDTLAAMMQARPGYGNYSRQEALDVAHFHYLPREDGTYFVWNRSESVGLTEAPPYKVVNPRTPRP